MAERQPSEIESVMRQAITDMIRKEKPSTVLGALIERSGERPVTIETIAGQLGKSVVDVEIDIELLHSENLALSYRERGVDKVIAFVPHEDEEFQIPEPTPLEQAYYRTLDRLHEEEITQHMQEWSPGGAPSL